MLNPSHSGHDYDSLLFRWDSLVSEAGLVSRILCESGGYPVIAVENERSCQREAGGVYLSAGVHGDECAPVWALLQWVESDPPALRERPITIFPCLNPHGLVENTRRDHRGVDLNRGFEDARIPLVRAWQAFLEGRRFDYALNLHEDYGAGGIYLYELTRSASVGEELLAACEHLIPRETASMVDGSDFQNGLLVHDGDIEKVVEDNLGGGYPEAIFLFLKFAETSLTFETPSEHDLLLRVKTQRTFIEAAMDRIAAPRSVGTQAE